jgi:hypothetical protein
MTDRILPVVVSTTLIIAVFAVLVLDALTGIGLIEWG